MPAFESIVSYFHFYCFIVEIRHSYELFVTAADQGTTNWTRLCLVDWLLGFSILSAYKACNTKSLRRQQNYDSTLLNKKLISMILTYCLYNFKMLDTSDNIGGVT